MNNFTNPFSFVLPTKIIYGPGSITSLADELTINGGTRPIIITDQGVRNAGILDKVSQILDQAGIAHVVLTGSRQTRRMLMWRRPPGR